METTPRPRLLFVVGLMRSGTSLLYALVNQHPGLSLMYEADVLTLPHNATGELALERLEFWNGALSRHGLDLDRRLVGARELYEAAAEGRDAVIVGEKSPSYCAILPQLAKSFPEARFLVIKRDFAEVYRSTLDAARLNRWWARPGTFYRLVYEQEMLLRGVATLRENGVPVYSIDYQSLVENPEVIMRGVSEFLGIQFQPKTAQLDGADLSALHDSGEHAHLHRRRVEARENQAVIPAGRACLIEQFQVRWDRMRRRETAPGVPELHPLMAAWVLGIGRLVTLERRAVRWIYEVAPLSMLQGYRELKQSCGEMLELATSRDGWEELRKLAWSGFKLSLMLAALLIVDWLSGPNVTLAPFYLLPPLWAARRLHLAAAMATASLAAIVWSIANIGHGPLLHEVGIFAWNLLMRWTLLAAFVLCMAPARFETPASRR